MEGATPEIPRGAYLHSTILRHEEVSFEGADGTFVYVPTMDVGKYQLVYSRPDIGDLSAEFLAGFVVEDLLVDDVTASLEEDYHLQKIIHHV